MATRPLIDDQQATDNARELFDEIRTVRQTEYVNNFWRMLAHDPEYARGIWNQLQQTMADGALSPLVKELIYIAVSVTNGCSYCIHSHTAAAKTRGMTDEMHSELLAVIAMAQQTNSLANALQVPVDPCFADPQ